MRNSMNSILASHDHFPSTNHEHSALPVERPADPKICQCGKQRDPVTHAWLDPDELEQLREERRGRRSRFGDHDIAQAVTNSERYMEGP